MLFYFVYWKQKEPYDILEEKNTPVLLDSPVKIEDQREPPMRQQSQEESSPRQPDVKLDKQELLKQLYLGQSSDEQIPEKQESFEQPSLGQPSQEQIPDKKGPPAQPSWGQASQEQIPDKQGPPEQPSLGQASQKQMTQGEHKEEHIPWKQNISHSCEEQQSEARKDCKANENEIKPFFHIMLKRYASRILKLINFIFWCPDIMF